jgi:type IV secretion system protein VirB11
MDRLQAALQHNLGSVVMTALRDPEVVEIMLNPDQNLWVERLGEDMEHLGTLTPAQSNLIISLVSSALNTTATVERPIVEGELPLPPEDGGGSRFEGLIPPIVAAPSFSIRKKASRVFTLSEYVNNGVMSSEAHDALLHAVNKRWTILVVGGTGSGKTTLVNAVIHSFSEQCPGDRLVVIEDTSELQSKSENTVFLRTSDFVTMQRLVMVSMRYRPTRILIGEAPTAILI